MQRLAADWKRAGIPIGFVPTMGYLHAGHMSLVAAARRDVGIQGKVVVSIYVNPTQFGPREDLTKYPRDLSRDRTLCQRAGVDVIFVPTDATMYPAINEGGYSTFVEEQHLSRVMEGLSRPTHFRGVTTIVAKLFNIVQPDVAVFGAKDYQQAQVIRRMARDLNFPTRIRVAPTCREPDGLAMSSRNVYLNADERRQAVCLSAAIRQARNEVVSSRKPLPASTLRQCLIQAIEVNPAARVDYVEFFHPESLQPADPVTRGSHMALAVFMGKTRLIDNGRL